MQHAHGHPARLAGTELPNSCHVCAFFHSGDEELDTLIPFVKEGLERGEKGFHIVDPVRRHEVLDRLRSTNLAIDHAISSGQLELVDWDDLRDEPYDPAGRLALFDRVFSAATEAGYAVTRLWVSMGWALVEPPGRVDLVALEARVNDLHPSSSHMLVCAYDLSRFNAGIVVDILRTHPHVILSGLLQGNPFYLSPDEILCELRARGTANLPDQSVA